MGLQLAVKRAIATNGSMIMRNMMRDRIAAECTAITPCARGQEDDPFFQVDQSFVKTSKGNVAVPMLFFDASYLISLFTVDAAKLAEAIGDVAVTPALDRNGKGIVGLAFYQYRHASIAAYNEVGLAVQVVRKGKVSPRFPFIDMLRKPTSRKTHNYLLHLPVTTQTATAAGLEIWGFPKFQADIPLSFKGQRFEGSVIDPETNAPIFTYSGAPGAGVPLPGMDLLFYTEVSGHPMEISVDTNYIGHCSRGTGMILKIGQSDHAMAQTLRMLDLDERRPFVTQRTERFQSRLHAPRAFS